MKHKLLLFIFLGALLVNSLSAQVESVIVETYYVSDANDATDMLGGGLEEGSVTYRVFVDLAEGSRLVKIFGSADHPIRIESTHAFFNNILRGKSFGYNIPNTNLKFNTMALDTWLTLGMATNKHSGILKDMDPDTSIVGGKYNDGGSAGIEGGLLVNVDPDAGVPVTLADGLVQNNNDLSGFIDFGIVDVFTGEDTTIFGNPNNSGMFVSRDMALTNNSGITGTTPDNIILVAQVTTKGEISFNLNLEVFVPDELGGKIIKYVANDTLLDAETVYNKWLSYPASCGCTDPNFLEYSPEYTCDDGSCMTPIIFGCLDPSACNYDPEANKNIPGLCCYDSKCALDLGIICPGTTYGCADPQALNYNPKANTVSRIDTCCYVAGCTDPLYLEFNPSACYDDGSFCKVLIIKGCMSPAACNYNPVANRHDESACVYDGEPCNTQSIESGSNIIMLESSLKPAEQFCNVLLFPNPATDHLTFVIETDEGSMISCELITMEGKVVYQMLPKSMGLNCTGTLDISGLSNGSYLFRVKSGQRTINKLVIKH